eukprot:gb/GEZN01014490.1/.p1 GENE.gb/GEZN01014490.1/~~gb/GEZN01014490.1/.p1  ORF type:complete len:249 (+),score=51.44 gb/GEZN01014490.1/:143-889(+)
MGLLFSGLWRKLWGYSQFKMCIVGLDNAGKTTTLYSLHLGELIETQPTIGSNVETVVHKNIQFQVWDLGGQASLRKGWETYYAGTNAVVLVVDSSDTQRIGLVRDELAKLLRHEDLNNTVILVFANKQDCKGAMSASRMAQALALDTIREHNWSIQPCCALTGVGLYEGMDWVVQQVTGQSTQQRPDKLPTPLSAASQVSQQPAASLSAPDTTAPAGGSALSSSQPSSSSSSSTPAASSSSAAMSIRR